MFVYTANAATDSVSMLAFDADTVTLAELGSLAAEGSNPSGITVVTLTHQPQT